MGFTRKARLGVLPCLGLALAAAADPVRVHDPSLVRTESGTHYLYGTHGGIRMYSSPDRVHFAPAGQAFAQAPAWTAAYTRGDLWAPDVSFHHGRYWLYYAASKFGTNTSAIGLATSATAAPGSWEDQGIVYSSDAKSSFNAIDPALIVDREGSWWLAFGSFWSGIQLIRIDPATGKQAAWDRTRHELARRPAPSEIEAPAILRHGKYYYLFVSFGQCCRGVNSTYRIMVGRAREITGPYTDRAGVPMLEGGGTPVVEAHGRIAGPGGQSVLDDGGEDLLVYHYYDAESGGAPAFGMDRLAWDSDGWPRIEKPTSASSASPR